MSEMVGSLRAEALKIKRSLALWLALVAPLAVAGYCILIFVTEDDEFFTSATFSAWIDFSNLATIFWALLMLPLFVTLQSALLAGLEHRNDQWKYLYALPLPRWTIYGAKQVGVVVLMALSHLALLDSILLGCDSSRRAVRQPTACRSNLRNDKTGPAGRRTGFVGFWIGG